MEIQLSYIDKKSKQRYITINLHHLYAKHINYTNIGQLLRKQQNTMKNLLNYQTSEYDCGPVSLLNGIRYLFEREEILPDLVKFIMLYCMDTYNEAGELCKHGTSAAAMNYMASWMNHFGVVKKFPLACEFLTGEEVVIAPENRIGLALRQGGVVVLHTFLGVPHYVLLTGIEGDRALLFDPFYEEIDDPELDEEYSTDEIEFIFDAPKKANRSVSIERMNRTSKDYYEMGEYACREALIMYNTALNKNEA